MRPTLLTPVVLLLPLVARAEPVQLPATRSATRTSPDGERVAEVRQRAKGGEAVWIDGRIGWPAAGSKLAPQIASDVVWSKKSDAVAFVGRERTGASTLVVVLVGDADDQDGEGAPVAITWAIPSGVAVRSVFWLGPQRVGVGPKDLDPKIVASWKTSR